MPLLDNRLMTAFGLCRSGLISADVGTDHARLAAALALEKSAKVYASDVRDGPLEAARRTVEEYGVKNVEIIKSDGLENIPYADDVIICGMGGELIEQIIGGCRFLSADTRFILQPMTKADHLRRWLCENGFEIIEEQTASDGGFLYTVMLVKYTGEWRDPDEIFALTGKNTDGRYLKMTAEKLLKTVSGMERSAIYRDEAERLRGIAEEILRRADKCK